MIDVAISRFKIDRMLSTKGSKAPGSFMDSHLYEQTVEFARQSSYTMAAEQLKPSLRSSLATCLLLYGPY